MLHLLQFLGFRFHISLARHTFFYLPRVRFYFIRSVFFVHVSLNVLFLFKWKFDTETDFYRWNMQRNIRVSFFWVPFVPFLLMTYSFSLDIFFIHAFIAAENSRCTSFTFVRAHHKIEICLYRKFSVILLRMKRMQESGQRNQRSKEQQQLAYSMFIHNCKKNTKTVAILKLETLNTRKTEWEGYKYEVMNRE